MNKKLPYHLKIFDPNNLSEEEEHHVNQIADLMDKMDDIFVGYTVPEVYNSLSAMMAKVICLSETNKEKADAVLEMILRHIKENVHMAEEQGNALWSRKLQ